MRTLMLGFFSILFCHCQNESVQDAPLAPAHEYVELHWSAAFVSAPKTITLNCIGDSVWLKMKEVGKETNRLTREKRNLQIGPGGQYDTVYYHKKLKPYPKGDIYEIGLHLIRLAGLKDEWSMTENQRSNF